MYRVDRYSCHPLISLCARMEKNNRVMNWPPSEMTRVQNLPPPKIGRVQNFGEFRGGGKSWTLAFLEGGKFWILSFERGGQFRTLLVFSILAHREIRGWQE